MKQTILVTGGTGYIGAWVVKGLLENGHTVRLTLRDKSKTFKYDFLEEIADNSDGKLEIWEADLLKAGSYDEAAKGCDSIAHVASPFKLNAKDPQKELIEPALQGTINVLEAANKSGTVKKVVLTSSVVAVFGDAADMVDQNLDYFTEEHFNTTSTLKHQPYNYSKVLAEKKAWEIAEQQEQWQLVVMNPAFVMGPALGKTSDSGSLSFIKDMMSGKFKSGMAELHTGFVDVRDIAKAHIYGLENEAEGRHILVERVDQMLVLAQILKNEYGDQYKLPTSNMPKWLLGIVGGLFGLSRKYVQRNVGIPIKLDNSKSKEKLKMEYIPLEQSVVEMAESLR